MAYTATIIANNVLQRAFRDKVEVSPMKLQKILYFVAAEYAKRTNRPLLAEPFQPWRYGPVLRSVYSEFKPFGGNPIRGYAKDAQGQAFVMEERYDPELADALNAVWDRTRNRSAVDLSRITHKEGSAWYAAFIENNEYIDASAIEQDNSYAEELALGTRR